MISRLKKARFYFTCSQAPAWEGGKWSFSYLKLLVPFIFISLTYLVFPDLIKIQKHLYKYPIYVG